MKTLFYYFIIAITIIYSLHYNEIRSSYEELFTPKPLEEDSYLPFIYKTDNDSIPERHRFMPPQTRHIEESCHITITQTHYELLSLFAEVNTLLNNKFSVFDYFLVMIKYPFFSFSRILFRMNFLKN